MVEETLGFSAMDDPVMMMPSSLEDFEMDLENLPRENHLQRRSMAAAATFSRERDLNIIRSGSAPPTVEGARTAMGSIFGDSDVLAGINFADIYDHRSMLSQESIRSRGDYFDSPAEESRIPLPAALSKEDWLIARRLQLNAPGFGGIGDRRGNSGGNGNGGLLFSPQPGLPPRDMGSELAKMRSGLRSFHRQPPPDDLIGLPTGGLNASKTFADALLMDRAQSSADTLHHQSQLMGLGPFENTIQRGTNPPGLIRAQSFNSATSDSFSPVIPRSLTPDPNLFSGSSRLSPNLGRRGPISPNGFTYGAPDRHDLTAALSAISLSANEGNFNYPRQQRNEEYPTEYRNYLHLKSMSKSEADLLNILPPLISPNADFPMNHASNFPLNQRIPNSPNNVVDTGGRNYMDPLLMQYLQGNDFTALNKNLLAQQMRFSRFPARRSPVGPTGNWNMENGPAVGGFGSSLLEEFKSSKTRNFELAEIVGHVVEFSADQHGSRFIQQKLEVASDEDKNRIFAEIIPHARALMTDVFGNYVIQKFFEHGTERQRKLLASQLTGHVLQLSLQMYGCRVIQKALEVVDVDQQSQMVSELDGSIMKCVRDQNGNHVIQKCIECIPQEKIQFIVSTFYGQVLPLSTHPYGCRVIQRVLEHCNDPKTQSIMMEEILQAVSVLTQDQYGNYVIQHVLQHGRPEERAAIIGKLAGQIVKMSQQKFASNVIEKCLTFGSQEERQLLINEILGPNDENEPLQAMMKDQFGNYVVQKVLETCDEKNRELILSRIKVHVVSLKKYTYGKHIAARVEKVIAAGERMSSNAC